jgi:cytochrome c peroxidase
MQYASVLSVVLLTTKKEEDSMHRNQRRFLSIHAKIVSGIALSAASACALAQPLPPVPFPTENQFAQDKADLGKILFWDEQLSSDNTMSCGSCHQPAVGGTDARIGINPGFDALFGTNDDVFGSPGVVFQDADDKYVPSPFYDLDVQVTGRQAPPAVMGMYAPETFWDGRATSQFTDPLTGQVLIASGGALESQAVGPPGSGAEMAHQSRDWSQILVKLTGARPLALSTNLPADMAAVIAQGKTYPEMFEEVFGDPELTAGRVAMAIATYERTLLPDQSPYDLFTAGVPGAMTPQQVNGLNAFRASICNACHTGAQFTDNTFRNIGVRPIFEDMGRFNVTNNPGDRGRFKVPSLRNTGLRDRYMHNGEHQTLQQIFDFYAHRNGQIPFPQNLDPFVIAPIVFPPPVQNDMVNFLQNGLTDPRVAAEAFPFDRPTLYAELPTANPGIIGGGTAGSGGFTPDMVADCPPNLGNDGFKVGINNALGGAQAMVALSTSPPVGGLVAQDELLGPITLEGAGNGNGYGTMFWPVPNDTNLDGQTFYMQWLVTDPGASGGISVSPVTLFTTFCSMTGVCVNPCPADMTTDGVLDFFDVAAFLTAFGNSDLSADLNNDGDLDFFDVSAFLNAFAAGCP